ncbi:MAG: signal peptidase I [Candidatus Ventricola sp.]
MSKPKRLRRAPTLEQLQSELDRVRRLNRLRRAVCRTLAVLALIGAVAAGFALMAPVLRVHGSSMVPTLQEGDVLVALRGLPCAAGDIAAFTFEDRILVKRIAAAAGDWVDIEEDGTVTVNGRALKETGVREQDPGTTDIEFPCQVPTDSWFVLGDNRAASVDSRSSAVGCLSQEQMIGRIVLRIWPPERFGLLHGGAGVGEE